MQSIDRAALLLRCFSVAGRQADYGVTELARRTGLTVSTTHRLLAAMARNGLLQVNDAGRYALGPLIGQLAGGTVARDLREFAPPLMARLRDEIDETVALHELLETGERAVMAQAESSQSLRFTEMGVPIPLPLGAAGKAILAFLPTDHCEAVLAKPIPRATAHTVTDPRRLRKELADIRRRGSALSFEERTPGVHSVAAPIFDHTSSVVGSLSVSAPKERLDRVAMHALVNPVKATASAISRLLGAAAERPTA